ncbi:adenylyl-sulfate kinase [Candidatus Pacearchaeota archaeon]|nr:adenylyl-sulfate kinase [Candidatus Pacearchaeota archaeon]
MIEQGDDKWREFIPKGADKVLKDYISDSGIVVWLTGLPKSGKTTIADIVSYELDRHGVKNERLDSHILRQEISKDLGFTKEDRDKNLENAAFIAKLLSRNGSVVISSFISPYISQRDRIRDEVEKNGSFIEVFVKASVETCKSRDKSGIYEKAEQGKIKFFTGVSDPYQEPEDPEIILDTENKSARECANEIVDYVLSKLR